jgi:hypothetical protein
MKRWGASFLYLAAAGTLAIAGAALSQDAPESLLPPGFGDPDQPLPPRQSEAPLPAPSPSATSRPPAPAAPAPIGSEEGAVVENGAPQDLETLDGVPPPRPPELPEWARRSTAMVGPLRPGNWGFAADEFGDANGAFLSTLMRRLDAPVPSRWTSILLRRSLLSHVPAPAHSSPVDWVAERAWLLLRMGEADGARLLVQAVDVDQFTPKMFQIAFQTALATADPAALCPLVESGRKVIDEPVWPLADAMCAALEGDAAKASGLIDRVRRYGPTQGIDLLLAEKVVGAAPNTRRAVTIEWDDVDALNSWRFGLASATGVTVPSRLMSSAGARMQAWQARAPMLPIEDRLPASDVAASLGIFSNAAMVEIYSLVGDQTDPAELRGSVAEQLRLAYTAADTAGRMAALRALWEGAKTPVQRHARHILTATAAARIAPSEDLSRDASDLIAAMLTAGLDRYAARWSPVVEAMDEDVADRPWALLALASAQPAVDISPGRVSNFAGRDDSPGRIRSRLLLAGLAGLGRLSANAQDNLAEELAVPLGLQNRWTAAIDQAAARQQPGTVILLAAIGMQARDWRSVPPAYLFHIVRALRTVGLEYDARMIAAEAQHRL